MTTMGTSVAIGGPMASRRMPMHANDEATSTTSFTPSVTLTPLDESATPVPTTLTQPLPLPPSPSLSLSLPPPLVDIDRDPSVQVVGELAPDIYAYLQRRQSLFLPLPSYMSTVQHAVTAEMRGILVDWLVEVAEEYKLCSETLYLTVHYVDRFLSTVPVLKSQLQLVGVAAALLAAKYEEIYPPTCEEFVYISDNTYERDEIQAMEVQLLTTLEFRLTAATAKVFLRRFLRAAATLSQPRDALTTVNMTANYVAELSLVSYASIRFLPSTLAAASVYLALYLCDIDVWDETMIHYTRERMSDEQFVEAIAHLWSLRRAAPASPLQAVTDKYSSRRCARVALLPLPEQPPRCVRDLQEGL